MEGTREDKQIIGEDLLKEAERVRNEIDRLRDEVWRELHQLRKEGKFRDKLWRERAGYWATIIGLATALIAIPL